MLFRSKEAFNYLVKKYEKKAYSVAYRIVRNKEDAYDVVQESFIKAYQSIKQFRLECNFYTWFHKIVVNLAINFVNSSYTLNNHRVLSLENLPENKIIPLTESNHAKNLEILEEIQLLEEKIKSKGILTAREIAIYHWHFKCNLSASKTAVKIGGTTTEKSISVSYNKIKEKLQQL